MKIYGSTRITAVFGYPVEHSLSPAMHNAAFDFLDMDYCYVAFPVAPAALPEAVRAVRALDMRGVNLTVPHKEAVLPLLDEVRQEAAFMGAVNTIENNAGRLIGHNTDGRGFMASLDEAGIDVRGKRILILGAGGAARAISYYLSESAGSLEIFSRTPARSSTLAADLARIGRTASVREAVKDLQGFDIVINTTPLGLKKDDPRPLDLSLLRKEMVICDLIYRRTPFLKTAAECGCRTMDGLGMLLHQGALAFEIWTGVEPPVEIMRNAIKGAGLL